MVMLWIVGSIIGWVMCGWLTGLLGSLFKDGGDLNEGQLYGLSLLGPIALGFLLLDGIKAVYKATIKWLDMKGKKVVPEAHEKNKTPRVSTCPVCDSTNVTGEDLGNTVLGDKYKAAIYMYCKDCDKFYNAYYTFKYSEYREE